MGRTSDAREKIITTAQTLIYERSYSDVGVQEICEQAGVNKGSFYHYFPSKRDLALAAIDAYAGMASARFEELFSGDAPLEDRVRQFFEGTSEGQVRSRSECGRVKGCPLANLALELSTQDEVIRERLQQVFTALRGKLEREISAAVERGEIRPVDAAATAQSILAFQEGAILLAKTHNDPDLIRRLAEGAVTLLHGGAGSDPPGRSRGSPA